MRSQAFTGNLNSWTSASEKPISWLKVFYNFQGKHLEGNFPGSWRVYLRRISNREWMKMAFNSMCKAGFLHESHFGNLTSILWKLNLISGSNHVRDMHPLIQEWNWEWDAKLSLEIKNHELWQVRSRYLDMEIFLLANQNLWKEVYQGPVVCL